MARHLEQPITAGSATLAGTLTLPDDAQERVSAVLLLASLLPRDRDGRFDTLQHPGWFEPATESSPGILARLASALADHGVASLRYDKRGCGQSDGSWEECGLFTLIDDARDALAVLRGHADVDPARIGLVGHGEGATLALSVAAADPAVGPLTVIGAPARGWRDVLRRGVAERARRRRGDSPEPNHRFIRAWDRGLEELIERADRGEARMSVPWLSGERPVLGLALWEQLFRVQTGALATLQQRSVTIVHGETDAWVDPAEAELLAAILRDRGAPATMVVRKGGHDLDEAPPTVFRDLAADLRARLQPRRMPTVLLSLETPPTVPG
jgi:pimeloyl-ACP methyl ester carboxylesterase